jgi:hypothetical protein
MPGYLNNAGGRGFGMGFRRGANFGGRGFRGGGFGRLQQFFATGMTGRSRFGSFAAPYVNADPAAEKQALKNQAGTLQSEMEAIKTRLDELDAKVQTK